MIVQYGRTDGPWRPCNSSVVLHASALVCAIGTDVGDQSYVTFSIVHTDPDTYNTPSSPVTTVGGLGTWFHGDRQLAACAMAVDSVPNGSPATCANKRNGETCSIACNPPYKVTGATHLLCEGTHFSGTQYCTTSGADATGSTSAAAGRLNAPLSPGPLALPSSVGLAAIGLVALL